MLYPAQAEGSVNMDEPNYALADGTENLLCEDILPTLAKSCLGRWRRSFFEKTYYEIKSFKIVQARYRRKFNFNTFPNRSQIYKLVKNFEAQGTCEDSWATCSSPSGTLITQDEYVRVINNFTRRIQQCFRLNDEHTEHELLGFCGHFWFVSETKWLKILKCWFNLFIFICSSWFVPIHFASKIMGMGYLKRIKLVSNGLEVPEM